MDLSPHYTGVLTEAFYPQFGTFDLDNELSDFPVGIGVFGGVTFDVRGVIALTIREATGLWREIWNLLPDRCLGIRVEDRFARLHVLHATAFAVAEGTPVAALILHYTDGTHAELDLAYGQHVRNWWQKPGEPSAVPHGKVVWQGINPVARAAGATLRLYLSTLENPYPDQKVTHCDFISKSSQAVPFVVVIISAAKGCRIRTANLSPCPHPPDHVYVVGWQIYAIQRLRTCHPVNAHLGASL